jgi:hypothetical protein
MGLIWQGLTHDLSKYSLVELSIAKYYTGKNSPHQVCREALGYSPSWSHHYHHNKHHYQYWQDQDEMDNIIPLKIPYKYVLEIFCDRVAACKAYNKDKYTPQDAWRYYQAKTKGHNVFHEETEYLLEKLLWHLYQYGDQAFMRWFRCANESLQKNYEIGYLKTVDADTAKFLNAYNKDKTL